VPKQHGGYKRKFSIIKGAQTKLEGMKKNLKDPKILSIKKNQYNDTQNQMKKTKRKRKSPSPTLGAQ
jgi:hypothetical protein